MKMKGLFFVLATGASLMSAPAFAATTYILAGALAPLGPANTADGLPSPFGNADGTSNYYWSGTAKVPGRLNFFLTATNNAVPQDATFDVYTSFNSVTMTFSGLLPGGQASDGNPSSGQATTGTITAATPFYIVEFGVSPTGTAFGGSASWAAVPEPSTWAMMGLGFAGLAFAGYRRRRTATAIA